jgi:hypothetical protein
MVNCAHPGIFKFWKEGVNPYEYSFICLLHVPENMPDDDIYSIEHWYVELSEDAKEKACMSHEIAMSASEALYGFAGWLTSLEKPVTLSAGHDAGIAARLVDEYCKANSLPDPTPEGEDLRKFPKTRGLYSGSVTDK